MFTNKQAENKFDEVLGQALKEHSEPVPADFTNRMLRQIREAQELEILAKVVLQERLALAGCIIFSSVAIVAAILFPDTIAAVFRSIAAGATQQGEALTEKIQQTIRAFSTEWQTYTILAGALGFAVYSLIELFLDKGLKTT